jgi:hypothetical protein
MILGLERKETMAIEHMVWTLMHPKMEPDMLGFVPDFFSNADPAPAKEQLNQKYQHGGGFRPFHGFQMIENGLLYPGDPIMPLLAQTVLHPDTDKAEVIRLYLSSWLAIVQLDGTYEICRVD